MKYVPFVINNMFMSTTVCVNNMFVSTTCLCQQQFVSTITCLCQQHVYVNNSLCQQQHVYVNNMFCQQKLNRTSLNTRPDKYCSKLCISGHFFMSTMWQYVTVNTKKTQCSHIKMSYFCPAMFSCPIGQSTHRHHPPGRKQSDSSSRRPQTTHLLQI